LALPAVSARASSLCGSGAPVASSAYCEFSSPVSYLARRGSLPSFDSSRNDPGLTPILSTQLLSFNATFGKSHLALADILEGPSSGPTEWAGRQDYGDGGSAGSIDGESFSKGIVRLFPDGDYGHPWKGVWVYGHNFWEFGSSSGTNSGVQDPDPGPLAATPEPVGLLLFGTGLVLLAFLTRRRIGSLRGDG
jgi:hypothetical protein